jgi:tetratricopeptide (TPR) repeat protein
MENKDIFQEGLKYETNNDYLNAAKEYRKLINQNKGNLGFAHQKLARALVKLGRLDEAKKISEKALEIDPELVLPHKIKGYVHYENGHYDLAAKEYKAALSKDPNDADALIDLSTILFYKLGKKNETTSVLNEGINNFPKNVDLYKSLIKIHLNERRYHDARKIISLGRKNRISYFTNITFSLLPYFLKISDFFFKEHPFWGAVGLILFLIAPFSPLYVSLFIGLIVATIAILTIYIIIWFLNQPNHKTDRNQIMRITFSLLIILIFLFYYWGIFYLRNIL